MMKIKKIVAGKVEHDYFHSTNILEAEVKKEQRTKSAIREFRTMKKSSKHERHNSQYLMVLKKN
jgi:hypothetical protein